MEAILSKRRNLKGRITRLEKAPMDLKLVDRYRQQVEQLWTELNQVHDELGVHCDDAAFVAHQTEYDHLADRIDGLLVRLPGTGGAASSSSRDQQPSSNSSPATTVRLPQLDLPTFSGNLPEWMSFFDLFTATIHGSEQLSAAQKLQYLKASLRGEAAQLLQSMQITDDNYSEAWDILKGRYHNKREIITAHLRRLCALPSLTTDAPAALRRLIDTTNETVRALRVLDAPVQHWDIILVHLVSERLDLDTRRQWELTLNSTTTVSYTDFMGFLDQRARALLTCAVPRPPRPSIPTTDRRTNTRANYHINASSDSCRICGDRHAIYKCSELLRSAPEVRRDLAKTHSLCFNCLAGDHSWTRCKAGVCRTCGGRHHTLLHLPTKDGTENVTTEHDAKPSDNRVTSYHSNVKPARDPTAQVLLATAVVHV